jgi:hypothetical protein
MRTLLVLAAAAVVGGCSGSPNYARPADESCMIPPCVVGGNASGLPGGGGGTVDGGTTTLGGSVGMFTDAEFSQATPFGGAGTIGVFGAAGPPNVAAAAFAGPTYSIPSAPIATVLWADVESPSTTSVMPTLTAIDGTGTVASVVAFVQNSVMAQIFGELSRAPQTLNTTRAQLVVTFVNSTGAPVSGVTVTLAPQGSDVAYDSGVGYTDVAQFAATGARGTALVLNAIAAPWPGALTEVSFKSGTPAVTSTFNAYVAQGAATITKVAIAQ